MQDLEEAVGSGLGFSIFDLILKGSLVFELPMIQILALSLYFKGEEHLCPLSPDLGLWRTL